MTVLGATPGLKIKLIDPADAVAKMNAKYGNLYATSVIKAGTYPRAGQEQPKLSRLEASRHRRQESDEMAHTIVKAIFGKQADLIALHREAENFSFKSQVKSNSTAPWHPGALQYFAERGVVM